MMMEIPRLTVRDDNSGFQNQTQIVIPRDEALCAENRGISAPFRVFEVLLMQYPG
jgi:tRNA A58 N-methylase Trm61